MTPEALKALRNDLGKAVMRVQLEHGLKSGLTAEEFVPELIAALISMAWFISYNCGLNAVAFLEVCLEAVKADPIPVKTEEDPWAGQA